MRVVTRTEQRTELSRERILDAAQTVIERDGDTALTFRRLGSELGADPTAAYRYFRSKDDLLLALGDRLLGEAMDAANAQASPDDGWRESLLTLSHELRSSRGTGWRCSSASEPPKASKKPAESSAYWPLSPKRDCRPVRQSESGVP